MSSKSCPLRRRPREKAPLMELVSGTSTLPVVAEVLVTRHCM